MKSNSRLPACPPLAARLFSVWFRHMRVYTKNIFSNGCEPFFEPMIFLAGIGLGLGQYVTKPMDGMSFLQFLGTGLLVTTAMFTSAFECSFATFIRLEFEKVYDGMLAAPISVANLVVGEILWAGSKGLFFSFAVMCMLLAFGIVSLPNCLLVPVVGFLTGLMFAVLSLFITSFIKTINHFNFYFTGFISPMFFFSGVVFPISDLPKFLQPICQAAPLTHSVSLVRAVCTGNYSSRTLLDLGYIVVFILVFAPLAINRLRKRLIV